MGRALAGPSYAEVAVPLPLLGALVYTVPADLDRWTLAGMRVRVPVGRRTAVGVVLSRTDAAPPDVDLKPIASLVDEEPVLSPELLELAQFTADYYLAPIGEVVRAMLPADLPAWGERRVWMTPGGAFAPARDDLDRKLSEVLLTGERVRLANLQRLFPDTPLSERIAQWIGEGRLAVEEPSRRGTRYRPAVELAPVEPALLARATARSNAARAIVDFLSSLGRPATVAEVGEATDAGSAAVRRLVRLGVLRQFTQPERLSLARHVLAPAAESAAPIELHADQRAALERLRAAVDAGGFALFQLAGVTGAGKTEVFLRAAEDVVARGRAALVLVPEIALVPALARAAAARFGDRLAVLHSGLGSAERHQEWERIRRGEATVVVGPRSAVFAPLARLGIVIVDEEQDASYKQESVPRYHGRDVALVRARKAGAIALLVSATPSLEARWSVEQGRAATLRLGERTGSAGMPEGILVDLRQEKGARRVGEVVFSARLLEEMERTLAAGDQIILLRNRRGYAPLLLCRACGEEFRCAACGLPKTLHRRERGLVCHYCGAREPAPAACPSCGAAALEPIGAGTERVEERLTELFPAARIDVLDRDAARRPGGITALLERFQRGETRILVGTQMVSKGHHFPSVALTAVLSADAELGFPDFRAVERTYSLLVQLAGRSGRGDRPGRVVIQTYQPDHYAIRAALERDDASFADHEMRFRRAFGYPPFLRMVQLLTEDTKRERALARLREIGERIVALAEPGSVRLTGPAPAPLERLRGRWRFQALLRAEDGARLRKLVRSVLGGKLDRHLTVDVDPYQLL